MDDFVNESELKSDQNVQENNKQNELIENIVNELSASTHMHTVQESENDQQNQQQQLVDQQEQVLSNQQENFVNTENNTKVDQTEMFQNMEEVNQMDQTELSQDVVTESVANDKIMKELVAHENDQVETYPVEDNSEHETISEQPPPVVLENVEQQEKPSEQIEKMDSESTELKSETLTEQIEPEQFASSNPKNAEEKNEQHMSEEGTSRIPKEDFEPKKNEEPAAQVSETAAKEQASKDADIEASIVRDLIEESNNAIMPTTTNNEMDMIDTSDLKPNEEKDLNQLVDSLINDVCNPNASKQEEDNDESNTDAVADVVAAVEAAAKASGSNSTTATTPKSTKKKSRPAQSPSKATINNHLNNSSLNNSLNNDTSPLSSNQKRRKKDPYAPKAPLNGYLVYFNEERADMRSKNPNMSFGELTKIIASKWKELPNEDKQKYINEADIDKERYVKEMADYKKSDAYKQYLKENSQAKFLRNDESAHTESCFNRVNSQTNGASNSSNQPTLNWLQTESNVAGFDIPIFTEEFIEHSRNREQETRQLRKELNELEQQNSVLNKHIDNLKQSTNKIEQEIDHFKNSNGQLQKNLDLFRQTILHCFNNIPLPNTQDYPTPSNIDEYIMRLYTIVNMINQNENNPNNQQNMNDQFYSNNRSFALHVKSVFSKINFNSLFECV